MSSDGENNYSLDPNKDLNTDYSKQIVICKPTYLIEVHGHGAKAACRNCIEISYGNVARHQRTMYFATILKNKLDKYKECLKILLLEKRKRKKFLLSGKRKRQAEKLALDFVWTRFQFMFP